MWMTIFQIALQLLAWWLDRSSASDELKKQFFEFVKKAGEDLGSVKLMQYGDAQLKWLREHPWSETK